MQAESPDIRDSQQDLADLQRAVSLLESPTLTARMADVVGTPLEFAVRKLPAGVTRRINGATEAALSKAASAALWSLEKTPGKAASTRLHKLAAAASGAVGGAFGFAALFVELPLSTTIMMRAVADVARSEGFDLDEFATRQACLEVFALGGIPRRTTPAKPGTTWRGDSLPKSCATCRPSWPAARRAAAPACCWDWGRRRPPSGWPGSWKRSRHVLASWLPRSSPRRRCRWWALSLGPA
jgi:hypothetical protein